MTELRMTGLDEKFEKLELERKPVPCYNLTCASGHGGIGRRARFRFWCPRRAGSSPVARIRKVLEFSVKSRTFFMKLF